MPPAPHCQSALRRALVAAVAACLVTAAQPARGAGGALFVASDGASLELSAALFDPLSNSTAPATTYPAFSCMMHPEGATLLADGDTVALSVRDLGLTRASLLLVSRPMTAMVVPTQAWCFLAWQTGASSVRCLADDAPTPKTDRTQLWRFDLGTGRGTLEKSLLFGFAPSEAFAFDNVSSSATGVYYNLSAGGLQQVLFTVDAATGETLHAAPVPAGTTFLQLKAAGDGRLLSLVSDAGAPSCALSTARRQPRRLCRRAPTCLSSAPSTAQRRSRPASCTSWPRRPRRQQTCAARQRRRPISSRSTLRRARCSTRSSSSRSAPCCAGSTAEFLRCVDS